MKRKEWALSLMLLTGASGAWTQETANPAGIQWVTIPGGSYTMGSGIDDEAPPHRVTIKSFQMAKTLTTNKQYRACVTAGACTPATSYGSSFDRDDQPVVGVKWEQAKAFSEWAGGRLPTEAEWEYAARSGGGERKYPWGDEPPTCARAVIEDCGSQATAPVCSKPSGNTLQGLCDMAGDAWEWVLDSYHDSYNGAPMDGSAWEDTSAMRVIRGGCWSSDGGFVRSALRFRLPPVAHTDFLGFRAAR